MARTPRTEGFFTFNSGLVTEAHILNAPEGALTVLDNFDIDQREGLKRRLGARVVSEHTDSMFWQSGISRHVKDSALPKVGITGSRIIEIDNRLPYAETARERVLVINTTVGTFFKFIDRGDGNNILEGYEIRNGDVVRVQQLQVVDGLKDAVESAYISMLRGARGDSACSIGRGIVSTNASVASMLTTDEVVPKNRPLEYREYKVYSEMPNDEDSGTLEGGHGFDVHNQGWTTSQLNSYHTRYGKYPALSLSPNDGYDVNDDGKEVWSTAMYQTSRYQRSTSLAARGNTTVYAFSGRRVFVEGTQERHVFTCSESYAGRIWYAGTTETVFYSKTMPSSADVKDVTSCMSGNSPTDRYDNDVLPTDGGTLNISGGGSFFCMREFAGRLLLFGVGGVWEISGGDSGSVVDSQDIAVRRLTDQAPLAQGSIASSPNSILYMSRGGIIAVEVDPESGHTITRNITNGTLDTYYRELPEISRANAFSAFSEDFNTIVWAMVDGEKIRKLFVDLTTGAFYPYTLDNRYEFTKIIPVPDRSVVTEYASEQVLAGTDVVMAGLDEVVIPGESKEIIQELAHPFNYIGFVEMRSVVPGAVSGTVRSTLTLESKLYKMDSKTYYDWEDSSYKSVVESSYDTWGNPASHKEIDTLFVWMDSTVIDKTKAELGIGKLRVIDFFKMINAIQQEEASSSQNRMSSMHLDGDIIATGVLADESS